MSLPGAERGADPCPGQPGRSPAGGEGKGTGREEESHGMRANKAWSLSALCIALLLLSAALGCGGGDREAKEKVDEALSVIASSSPLLDDLVSLDARLDDLGTRFTEVQDTVAEGKSLVAMALADIDELESRYIAARQLLQDAAQTGKGSEYAEYAGLALQALDTELEAFSTNRRLLEMVCEMLDVTGQAEKAEQLSYYMEEIERLSREVTELLRRGSELAEVADEFYRRHHL